MPHDDPRSKNFLPDSNKRREVAAIVARLMSHYWAADDPEPIRKAQAEDWIADLFEFEIADIVAATTEWRRASTRRPTIADIRLLCIQEQTNRGNRRVIAGPQNANAYAKSAGFASDLHRRDAIRKTQERYVKAQAWRNAGMPKTAPYGLTPENIREARKQLGCDDDYPLDLRWQA
jgi:hypothetical protein